MTNNKFINDDENITEIILDTYGYIKVIQNIHFDQDNDNIVYYYDFYFHSKCLDFYCNLCNTNNSYNCLCDEIKWNNCFLKNHKIITCYDIQKYKYIFDIFKNNISFIFQLSRKEFCNWLNNYIQDDNKMIIWIDF